MKANIIFPAIQLVRKLKIDIVELTEDVKSKDANTKIKFFEKVFYNLGDCEEEFFNLVAKYKNIPLEEAKEVDITIIKEIIEDKELVGFLELLFKQDNNELTI